MTTGRPLTLWQKTKIALAVLFHNRTPFSSKALIGAGILYGIVPIDVVPDYLPFLGALDDVAVCTGVILLFLRLTKALRKEMERTGHSIDGQTV